MALIDKIFGHKKTLSELNRQELRKEEILLTKQRDRLFKRIEQISVDKQKIFQNGAQQKSPELRKALAQDFELKTQEQLMCARELNLRSKELLTVSRLRMVKENNEKGRALGRLNLTDKDVAKISGWIEDDSVSQDMYNETESSYHSSLSSAALRFRTAWSACSKAWSSFTAPRSSWFQMAISSFPAPVSSTLDKASLSAS